MRARACAGYIEYADKMSILPALALNGQLLAGHPVLVKPSESEKNAAAQLAKVQAAMVAAPNPLESQLRISNVHKNVRERDLEDIFSPFGKIEQLEIQEDAAGGDLGMAAVQFTDVDAARKAMQALNGLELAGATIVVTTAVTAIIVTIVVTIIVAIIVTAIVSITRVTSTTSIVIISVWIGRYICILGCCGKCGLC